MWFVSSSLFIENVANILPSVYQGANLFLHGFVEVAGFTVMLLLKLHEFISIPLEASSEALKKKKCKNNQVVR